MITVFKVLSYELVECRKDGCNCKVDAIIETTYPGL